MKVLLLNSGMGKRMGNQSIPKCMTILRDGSTIIERQITQLERAGIKDIVITTGPFADVLERHVRDVSVTAEYSFVNNPDYASTNYIYSIFLAKELLYDDIILLHGDLVFADDVLCELLRSKHSNMIVSSTSPLPKKDFKAVIRDGLIAAVGVDLFEDAVAALPMYKIYRKDWLIWLEAIGAFIKLGETGCYAESAFNDVSDSCHIYPLDIRDGFCSEIDTPEDLNAVNSLVNV